MDRLTAPSRLDSEEHQRGAEKLSRIPVKVSRTEKPARKPRWIRAKAHNHPRVAEIKRLMRDLKLSSVCEEAACPNLGECFAHGTATFMILGDICTRRCPFCDVAHGKPKPPDADEPANLADAVKSMGLNYVVITSVDRDDLRDGGAQHFADCIGAIREACPETQVEILVPDFRGRMDKALDALAGTPSDVFNHNLETIPRLYRQCRPGADYAWSLKLLEEHGKRVPGVPTKSGLMLGLGETNEEVLEVMRDMRAHNVQMLTLGQYLQPSLDHHPVERFVTPEEFDELRREGEAMGFTHVASGPMVRSSYHADQQAAGAGVRD
ncbi:lipoyl synthase [Granulosicoccaceae sp. 1_MG-2023]|nr:lipoyl synthase [Granulosicoccaceae sp. 1_MG-2023]